MISMTYDQRRETFGFVWRKIPFVFSFFGLVDARNATARVMPQGLAKRASRRPDPEGEAKPRISKASS
jgi:hypothetical protein